VNRQLQARRPDSEKCGPSEAPESSAEQIIRFFKKTQNDLDFRFRKMQNIQVPSAENSGGFLKSLEVATAIGIIPERTGE